MMINRSKDKRHLRWGALKVLQLAVFLAVCLCQAALASSLTADSISYIAEASSLGDLATSQDESGWANYILVVDNSGSTIIGLKSTGGVATDKEGLRFSACRLFSDVLPTSHNRMGVILFSGSKKLGSEATCTVLGPANLSDPSSVSAIRDSLSDKNVIDMRGDLTDIDFALNKAISMAESFPNGDTKIVLITDGLNDLTDTDDALTNPRNLEANERTLSTIGRIVDSGMKFYVVGLTAGGDSPFRQQFMNFINDMGRVGGGEEVDGRLNNVFEAKAADLNRAILEISGAPASSPEVVPVTIDFEIPDIGIQEASVTVSFATGDKHKLMDVSLIDPSDSTRDIPIWSKNGMPVLDRSRFSVQEDVNYINVHILKPTPGNWRLAVTGEQTDIYITTKLDQNTQIRLQGPVEAHAGESVDFKLYYQTFEGSGYRDTDRQTLYEISTARLTFTSPAGEVRQLPMTALNLCFGGSIVFDQVGEWHISAQAENRYHTRQISDIAFTVTEAPKIDPVVIESFSIAPDTDVNDQGIYVYPSSQQQIDLGWSITGNTTQVECSVTKEGMRAPETPQSSGLDYISLNAATLEKGAIYNATLSVGAQDGNSKSISLQFIVMPEPVAPVGFTVRCENEYRTKDGVIYTNTDKALLSWSMPGDDLESVQFVVTCGQGDPEVTQAVGSEGKIEINLNENEISTVRAVPIPRYGGTSDGEAYAQTLAVTPIMLNPVVIDSFTIAPETDLNNQGVHVYPSDQQQIDIGWTVTGDTTQVECSVTKEDVQKPLTPQSSGPDYISLNVATLEKGVVYHATLNVGAQDGNSKSDSLQFTINPEPVPPVGFALSCENEVETKDGVIYTDGNKAELTWSVPGVELESVQFEVTRGQGDPEVTTAKGSDGKIRIKLRENELSTLLAVPIPRYGDASDGEPYAQMLTVTPKVLSTIEKLKARLPLILGIFGGVLVLTALIVVIYLIKRPKLRGKLNLIMGNDTFPYTIDLKGRPEGTALGGFKDLDQRYKDQLFLKSLKLVRLYMDRTDQYGSISMDSNPNPRYSLPNATALRIDVPDGQVCFAVSKENTALFTITDDNGQDVRCAITYAEVDQPGYPDLN